MERRLWRSRNGMILGVCRGVADYLNVSAFWLRAAVAASLLITGVWPTVIAYVLAALMMRLEPRWRRYDFCDF